MNPTGQTSTNVDLTSLRKAVEEFKPNTGREPFNQLKPHHDSIVALRRKKASYVMIARLLKQHGVQTSLARVAEYGRIVLEGGKHRKPKSYHPPTSPAPTPKTEPQTPAKITSEAGG